MRTGTESAEPHVKQVRSWALVWVAVGASLWGFDTPLRQPLTATLSSPQIVLAEHLILSAVLIPLLWRARAEWRKLRAAEWGAVAIIAWGGSALATILFTEAIRKGNPTSAVLLQKIQPLFAAMLARALLKERLDRAFWLYLAAALAGAYLVSFGAALPLGEVMQARAAAAAMALGAASLWGGSTVLGRFLLRKASFSTLTALRIVVAAPLLFVFARLPASVPAPQQTVRLLLLALVPGLLALMIYYRGLRAARASLAAIAELSFPATAALLNWLFLGADVSAAQLAGFGLLWAVILRMNGKTR